MLCDRFGRRINYLRVSVTDRCNLRCLYCSQRDRFSWLPPEEILSYEELFEVIQTAVTLGFTRLRLTGGEPLLRKGLISFIARLSNLSGLKDLTMTTNGTLLSEQAQELKKAGLRRINISLDTLDPQKFEKITGRPYLSKVLEGIEAALRVGFSPVKINVVVMRGINDDELLDLAGLAKDLPLEVRFIEFMPVGEGTFWNEERLLDQDEMKRRLAPLGRLSPVDSTGAGPATTYVFPGAKGKIGFIGAMTHHFCQKCNRLRLTPEGRLRPCLFSDEEVDLKGLLRRPHTLEEVKETIKKAVFLKPATRLGRKFPRRLMRSIGG